MDAATTTSITKGKSGASRTLGIAVGSLVRTLDGLLPVEFLSPGDRIVCRQGARRLLSLSASRSQRADLVRIRASTLGHDRPDQDLLLGCDQPVLIRDWRAMALYGLPVAEIPAVRLVDGEFVLAESRYDACLFSLQFADDEVIYADGLEIACSVHAPTLAAVDG